MQQIKKSFQALEKGGNSFTEPDNFSLSTPRQDWLKKEKQIKMKFYLLFILSHALWPLSLYTHEPIKKDVAKQAHIDKNHYIIQLPANVLITNPKKGEKVAVSVIYKNNIIFKKAYLHAVTSSHNSPTGLSAKLEIAKSEVHLLKNLKHKILEVLPPIQTLNTSAQKNKRGPHETTI